MNLFLESEEPTAYFTSAEGEDIIDLPSRKICTIARILSNSGYRKFKVRNNRGSFWFTMDDLLIIADVERMRKLNLSYKMIAEVLELQNKKSQPKDTSWADNLNHAIWRRF